MDPLSKGLAVGEEILLDPDHLPGPVGIPGNAGLRVERPGSEAGTRDRELELPPSLLELLLGGRVLGPVADIGGEDPSIVDLDLEDGQLDRDQSAILMERLGLDALADQLRRPSRQIGLDASLVRGPKMAVNDDLDDGPADRLVA